MIRRLRLCFPLVGLLLAVLLFLSQRALAQQRPGVAGREAPPPSTRRCRYLRLPPGRDTTSFSFSLTDTLTIVPSSVAAAGRAVRYDPRTDRYQLIGVAPRNGAGPPLADSVLLCYRVLPLRLLAPRFRRPRQLMDSLEFRDRRFGFEDFAQKEQILSTPGINKTGNLARGISFGNTQNVFVNSALNLQLEGKLTENINLTAAISDQNVPFQPEGNTQQLQQFDRIYITLTAPQWSLTAGDVVLRGKPDYFLRYYKNIQGAAVETNLGPPGPGLGSGTFTAAPAGAVVGNPGNIGSSNGPGSVPAVRVPVPGAVPAVGPDGQSATVSTAGRDARRREIRSSTTAAGGVAKGKFASVDILPIENVQGAARTASSSSSCWPIRSGCTWMVGCKSGASTTTI